MKLFYYVFGRANKDVQIDFSTKEVFFKMSVKIRLTRHGSKKRPFYRIVIADSRSPRGLESLRFVSPEIS